MPLSNPQFVLLVDDEEIVRHVCERVFAAHKPDGSLAYPDLLLDTAANLQDALDKVDVFAYEWLILDMAFPDGGCGLDVLRRVRSLEMDTYMRMEKLAQEARIIGDMQILGRQPVHRSAAMILTGTMSPAELVLDARSLGVVQTVTKPVAFTEAFVEDIMAQMQEANDFGV